MIGKEAQIHPWAHVQVESCEIGDRTKVWQFASIIRGAKIGSDCSIASCAIVDGAMVGNGSIISHGVFLDPGAEIGHRVFLGPYVLLCNDVWPTVSKEGFDMDRFFNGLVTTKIEDDASLGANVVVLPGVRIGKGAMVAAGSIVTKNIPDGCLHKRSGEIVPIDYSKIPERIRPCSA